jgi:O-methyltransferase
MGAVLTATDRDAQSLYLDRIRRQLTRYGMRERMPAEWSLRRRLLVKTYGTLAPLVMRINPFGERKRDLGLDWPAEAETMIGMQRLTSLQRCVETVLTDDVPGDLVECGVWRGGASILMRAVLAAYGDQTRCVWLADSFEGLPIPDTSKYNPGLRGKLDKLLVPEIYAGVLAVPETEVRANFERYGLLDDQVRFLPGWFKDTLPNAPIDRIALLRLDGDLYDSTMESLDALYPRLSPEGFCIIDDYALDGCRQAVTDYRAKHGVSAEIVDIDGFGALWRK